MLKLKYLVLLLGLLLLPIIAEAANDVTVGGGASIVLPADSSSYSLSVDTTVQSFTVNNSTIDFVIEGNSIINMSSADRKEFTVYNNNQCSVTKSCSGTASSVYINCPNNAAQNTITITPSGTCTVPDSGGGGGGGGGGGVTPTPTPTPETTPTPTPETTPTPTPETTPTPTPETTPTPTAETATCSLDIKGAYKSPDSPAVYYITEACEKRPFNRSNVFFTYFDSWQDVKVVVKDKLTTLSDDTLGFMPWGPKYDPKYGALVKIVTDPKVYLLLGEEKYWINSEDVFNNLNYKWNWIEDIDKKLLDKYLTGSEINYTDRHPNYTLVKYAKNPKVYRLEPDPNDSGKQVRRHIKDEKAFNTLNFRWDRIVTIADAETYTDGAQLTQ